MSKIERFFALASFVLLAVGFAGAFSGQPVVLELGIGGAIFSALISVLVGDRQDMRGTCEAVEWLALPAQRSAPWAQRVNASESSAPAAPPPSGQGADRCDGSGVPSRLQ